MFHLQSKADNFINQMKTGTNEKQIIAQDFYSLNDLHHLEENYDRF